MQTCIEKPRKWKWAIGLKNWAALRFNGIDYIYVCAEAVPVRSKWWCGVRDPPWSPASRVWSITRTRAPTTILPRLLPERSMRRRRHLYPRFPRTSATRYCSTARRGRGVAGSGAPGHNGVTGERRANPAPGHTLRLSEGHESKGPTGTITSSSHPSTLEARFRELYTYNIYSISALLEAFTCKSQYRIWWCNIVQMVMSSNPSTDAFSRKQKQI